MQILKDQVVSIHYHLKDDSGKTLDNSEGNGPLVYIHGHGHIIPGLEKALEGKTKGDKIDVTIPPEEAYGQRNDQMVYNVPKSEFKTEENIEVGMQFQVDTDNGQMVFTVIKVEDTEVIMDGNHPLAGTTLNFSVEVVDLRAATSEELAHGHVHGEGGHKH